MENPKRARSRKRRRQAKGNPKVVARLEGEGGDPRGCVWWKPKVQSQTERKRNAVRRRQGG